MSLFLIVQHAHLSLKLVEKMTKLHNKKASENSFSYLV